MINDTVKGNEIRTITNEATRIIETFDATRGYLRYEAIRKLNVSQFSQIFKRNLKGENFDDMIDELIIKNKAKL